MFRVNHHVGGKWHPGDSVTVEDLHAHGADIDHLKRAGAIAPVGDEPAGGTGGVRLRSEPDHRRRADDAEAKLQLWQEAVARAYDRLNDAAARHRDSRAQAAQELVESIDAACEELRLVAEPGPDGGAEMLPLPAPEGDQTDERGNG